MSNFTYSSNMSLRQINEKYKFWYVDWLVNFSLIDSHNHSVGKGVQVPEGGIATGAITSTKISATGAGVGKYLKYDTNGVLVWSNPAGTGTIRSGTAGRLAIYEDTDTILTDLYSQNGKDINIIIAPHSALAADRVYTITEIGEDADFVMTKGTQIIGSGKTLTSPHLDTPVLDGGSGSLPPLGSIIAWYPYDSTLVIALETDYWAYCDGTTGVVFGDGKTRDLPDLSNRYLVGFGTEGGGDIDSAAWATAVVGAASHSITLTSAQSGQKAVTTDSGGVDHTHTGYTDNPGNHTHTFGGNPGGSSGSNAVKDVVAAVASFYVNTGAAGGHTHSVQTYGASAYAHTHTITGSDAVDSHSIQPRSIRVRWIIRIK